MKMRFPSWAGCSWMQQRVRQDPLLWAAQFAREAHRVWILDPASPGGWHLRVKAWGSFCPPGWRWSLRTASRTRPGFGKNTGLCVWAPPVCRRGWLKPLGESRVLSERHVAVSVGWLDWELGSKNTSVSYLRKKHFIIHKGRHSSKLLCGSIWNKLNMWPQKQQVSNCKHRKSKELLIIFQSTVW